jgi:hypothetical protein
MHDASFVEFLAIAAVVGGCDDDVEFAFALDLILDGLDRRHRAA